MQSEDRAKSQTIAEIESDANTQDRQRTNEQFYQQNYGRLLDSCLESGSLFIQDAERLIQNLAAHLPRFTGSTDEEFIAWASDILRPAAERLSAFYALRTPQNERGVRNGIRSVLKRASDLGLKGTGKLSGDTEREIEEAAWFKVFEGLDAWIKPGRAKLTTRLYAQGRSLALGWRTSSLRHRDRHPDVDVERCGADAWGSLHIDPQAEDDSRHLGTD
ncbi:MAG TPA: hypothetical protein VFA60_01125 [Terriglobales bacterium]|nr:hypothetical protein [Terriglobales bacterium]